MTGCLFVMLAAIDDQSLGSLIHEEFLLNLSGIFLWREMTPSGIWLLRGTVYIRNRYFFVCWLPSIFHSHWYFVYLLGILYICWFLSPVWSHWLKHTWYVQSISIIFLLVLKLPLIWPEGANSYCLLSLFDMTLLVCSSFVVVVVIVVVLFCFCYPVW